MLLLLMQKQKAMNLMLETFHNIGAHLAPIIPMTIFATVWSCLPRAADDEGD
jgi:hypothetical protein